MPFEALPPVPYKPDPSTPPNNEDVLTVVDDNDILLLVQDDNPVDDVLFLKENVDGVIEVRETPDNVPVIPALLTPIDKTTLVDAGPVFIGDQGPRGFKGEDGLDLYHTWQIQTGRLTASFDDFMDYVRQGLGSGQGGTGNFVFNQYDASAVWTIVHNLNCYPTIICEDSAGEIFEADYRYLNQNVMEVHIIAPVAGKAYLR